MASLFSLVLPLLSCSSEFLLCCVVFVLVCSAGGCWLLSSSRYVDSHVCDFRYLTDLLFLSCVSFLSKREMREVSEKNRWTRESDRAE